MPVSSVFSCMHVPDSWLGRFAIFGVKCVCMQHCADFDSGLLLTNLSPSKAAQPSLETLNLCIFYILKNSSKAPQRLLNLLFWASKKWALASNISLVGSLLSRCAISWSWFCRSSQVTSDFSLLLKKIYFQDAWCKLSRLLHVLRIWWREVKSLHNPISSLISCFWQWWLSVLLIRVPVSPLCVNLLMFFLR